MMRGSLAAASMSSTRPPNLPGPMARHAESGHAGVPCARSPEENRSGTASCAAHKVARTVRNRKARMGGRRRMYVVRVVLVVLRRACYLVRTIGEGKPRALRVPLLTRDSHAESLSLRPN